MIVSDAQQSDSAIQVHVSILPQTPLPSKLPYNIEQSTLCYTVRPGDGGLIIKLCPTLAAAWTAACQEIKDQYGCALSCSVVSNSL